MKRESTFGIVISTIRFFDSRL